MKLELEGNYRFVSMPNIIKIAFANAYIGFMYDDNLKVNKDRIPLEYINEDELFIDEPTSRWWIVIDNILYEKKKIKTN